MVCLHMMLTAIWLSWNSERRTCNCGGYSLLWGCRSDNPKSVQWFYSCHRDHPMGYLREQNSYNCLPFMKQSRSRLVSRITACVISWVATTSMGAVIARSNIIWFCTQHNRDWSRNMSQLTITICTAYLAPTGEPWGVHCGNFGENSPRYNGTALCKLRSETGWLTEAKRYIYKC